MSKRHKDQELRYRGMDRSREVQVSAPGPLVVERAPGRPDLVQISINAALAPPERALFADYVQVERVRDGVRILFGKLHPTVKATATSAIEVSVPLRPFVNQLYRSFNEASPHGEPFLNSVASAVPRYGYERITSLEPVEDFGKVTAFRSNFVYMALHYDDAAIDFFHLDATTMRLALEAIEANSRQPGLREIQAGFKGILRVVVSPSVLLFFLEECKKLAEELKKAIPTIDESLPQLPGERP